MKLNYIIIFGVIFGINFISRFLPKFAKDIIIGMNDPLYPFSFQNIMWLIFGLSVIYILKRREENIIFGKFLDKKYLPENFEDIISDKTVSSIVIKSKKDTSKDMAYLPKLILQVSSQYQANKSIGSVSTILSQQLDLFFHQIELRYTRLKYLSWLIPTIGFMGTVYGISLTVSQVGASEISDPSLLKTMAGSLAVAFNTTLLALFQSAILHFYINKLESMDEEILNNSGEYVLTNFVNRLIDSTK